MTDLLRLRLVRLDPGRVVNLLVRLARIQKGVLLQREGNDERVVAELEILSEPSVTHGSVTVLKEGVRYRHEERENERRRRGTNGIAFLLEVLAVDLPTSHSDPRPVVPPALQPHLVQNTARQEKEKDVSLARSSFRDEG